MHLMFSRKNFLPAVQSQRGLIMRDNFHEALSTSHPNRFLGAGFPFLG